MTTKSTTLKGTVVGLTGPGILLRVDGHDWLLKTRSGLGVNLIACGMCNLVNIDREITVEGREIEKEDPASSPRWFWVDRWR